MQVAKHREITAPFAWSGADLQQSTDWIRPFSRAEFDELDSALRGVRRRGLVWLDVTRDDFPYRGSKTAEQVEALQPFDTLTDELARNMSFEPGDIQLLNNHLIYHSRTDFVDFEEPERKRLLLRLWSSVPAGRPLPDGWELVFGTKDAGAVRGSVPSKEGWRDVNELRARKRSVAGGADA